MEPNLQKKKKNNLQNKSLSLKASKIEFFLLTDLVSSKNINNNVSELKQNRTDTS